MRRLRILLPLILFFAAPTNAFAQKSPQITEITLEKKSSWQGFMYKYVLRSDGTATLYGPNLKSETTRKLSYHGQFTEFDRVARFVMAQRFFNFDQRYESPDTDANAVIVGVVRNGRRREVTDYGGAGPACLRAIEDVIQSVGEKIKWDKTGTPNP
jgi:hypothetical protein